MTSLEHYFENTLLHGRNENDPNIEDLSFDEILAVDTCVDYVIHTLFNGREDFNEFMKRRRE